MKMPTRVLLADDHRIMREGLRALLKNESRIEVVGEAEDGRGTVSLAKKLRPAVVIMDVAMPDLNGIEATRQIIAAAPTVRVLALSMHADRRFVNKMLQAGAAGYMLKDCAFEELAVAIQTVAGGQNYLSSQIASIVLKDYLHHALPTVTPDVPVLTPRKLEILQLLAEGKSTKQVADVLHVSPKTVETHRKQIMDKLGVYTIAELTKYAVREGLTSLEP